MAGIDILEVILIMAFIAAYIFFLFAIIRAATRGTFGWITTVIAAIIGLLLVTYLSINIENIEPADWAQILPLLGLVAVTGFYAWRTHVMSEEMREQRYDTARPVIDIYRDQAMEDKMPEALEGTTGDASRGLSCVLKSIGLGPAIDVYSFIQNPFSGERQRHEFGTLAIGEMTFRMKLSLIHEGNPLALVAHYKDVYGRAFVSKREVSTDKKKGWQIGPLQTRPVTQDELP